MDAIETEKAGDFTIVVNYALDTLNPREDYDTTSKFVFKHDRHNFLWECDEDFDDYSDLDYVAKGLVRRHDAKYIFPVTLTDHSGLFFRVGRPLESWDSGLVGLAFVTHAKIEEMRTYFGEDWDEETWVKAVVTDEVDLFEKYINGWGYDVCIYSSSGELVDVVGGFWEVEEALELGREIVNGLVSEKVDA